MPQKKFNSPFWVTLVMAVIVFAAYCLIYIQTEQFNNNAHASQHVTTGFFYTFCWPALLFIDAIIYYTIRRKITGKVFVWLHISCIIITFFILPAVVPVLALIAGDYVSHPGMLNVTRFFQRVQPAAAWTILIIGHAFFIATIAKSFTKKV